MNISDDFTGKIALITGSGRGLGFAFAQALAVRGARIGILDVDDAAAEKAGALLREEGHAAIAFCCDVADRDSVASAVRGMIDAFGGIDILVNNAGLHSFRYNVGFAALAEQEIRRLFDVNLLGTINCSLACRDAMRARGGGAIVNIASTAAFTSSTAYGVSKLAVRGATICLAGEFAADGIRINAIAPGLIGTDTNRAELPSELFDDYENRLQLVKRAGTIEDIVEALLYLCSSRAGFVTGETVRVSGGYPLHI